MGGVFLEVCVFCMLQIAAYAAWETFSLSRFAPRRSATIEAKLDRREVRSFFVRVTVSSLGETCSISDFVG